MVTNENGATGEGGAVDNEHAGGRVVRDQSTRHPFIVAAELLAESAERERTIFEHAWSTGYGAGFDAGTEVGYDCAEAEMAQAWAPVAESVRRLGRSLSHAELERRRWDGRREDFGKPRPGDYRGGPVPWDGRRASA
ncbi:hypothetical protein SAMN05443665_104570 [Actinomadura meyerae]|uniref:Uncharacterized protein n=1 Tax=Actinomadura meyerae TaxID=240840 RepID=A0A239NQJ7_9ACTN|nr:hypothetical protein [Actinomadura meyerae]SNT56678.1 hypothetical protein SAMN05443665_104570 [Actinomadura meyerae]